MEAYIYDGIRSPFGKHGGVLAGLRPDDLAAQLLQGLVAKTDINPSMVEDVILGCTNQAGEDSRNLARNSLLLAGFPVTVGGQTINGLCASGLGAIVEGARAIALKEGELIIAGGVESMSRAPYVMSKPETAYGRDSKMYDSTIGARFPNKKVLATYGADTMPETGDNVAKELDISIHEANVFAYWSQQRYDTALHNGFFNEEIVQVKVKNGYISKDEHPRPSVTIEQLEVMKPLFEGGVVTAGNATGINDGGALVLLGSLAAAEAGMVNRAPLAKILSTAVAGVQPRVMGLGPVEAINKALARAGLTIEQMDVIEINEAFASQVIGCLKGLGLSLTDSRVNPNGGAIAIGHPLGASGARLALTAARQLQLVKGRYAVVSLCIGMGQGLAVVLERNMFM